MSENKFNFADILKRNAEKISSSEEDKKISSAGSEVPSESSELIETSKKQIANRTRNKNLALKFTAEEIEEINKKIEQSKLSKTDFILNCIREKDVVVIEDLSEALIEIRRQGVNLNQMAKAINGYYYDLRTVGLLSNGIEEDLKRFYSELAKLQIENRKTLELLNKIFEKVV